ncbi:MAG: riboflavin biosynthesis protein RibF [Bacteroidaceae bacterium]|nr:riboflavin biosynthesis protein RibF [Bacteroidaceae bacterium]
MQKDSPQFAATIGFFDGVHLGHRFLLKQLQEAAIARGLKTMAITFLEHPRQTLHIDYQPQLLTTLDERIALIQDCGIDEVRILEFTEETAKMTSRTFMTEVLRKELNISCLLMGYDHHFGSDTSSKFSDYVATGRELGIEVVQALPFASGTEHVSSSSIRQFLAEGDVERAAQALHRYYSIAGTVVAGHKVGRSMGFPTANIRPHDQRKMLPRDGAYAVDVTWQGKQFRGVLNIGHRPTLNNGTDRSVEVFILDFSADIYGEELRVEFLKHLRSEKRFASLDELRHQILEDASLAKKV